MSKMSGEFKRLFGGTSFYYRGKTIPVESLGLNSDYLLRFCAYMTKSRDWDLRGITYNEIRKIRCIGDAKARAIAEALVTKGVEIEDIPELVEPKPTKLIPYDSEQWTCTNCNSVFIAEDSKGELFNYCPMCGRKFKWGE